MNDLKSITKVIKHIGEYKESLLPVIKHMDELINLIESEIAKNEDLPEASQEINKTEIAKKFEEFEKIIEKQEKLNDVFLKVFIDDAKKIINDKIKSKKIK